MTRTVTCCDIRLKPRQTGNVTQRRFRLTRSSLTFDNPLKLIEGVLRLADRSVRVIMTPHTRIVWVDVKADRNTIIGMVKAHRFSRLLVCDKTADHPVGFTHTKDLLPRS
jgi:putative hemolysin